MLKASLSNVEVLAVEILQDETFLRFWQLFLCVHEKNVNSELQSFFAWLNPVCFDQYYRRLAMKGIQRNRLVLLMSS